MCASFASRASHRSWIAARWWPGWRRFLSFLAGLAILSAGILLVVRNPWGAAAWDVFHLGLAHQLGLSLGTVSILVSLTVVGATWALGGGWTIRIGTLLNAILVGVFIDLYTYLGLIPPPSGLLWGLGYLAGGVVVLALGTVLYLRTGLGAGARDGLMLVLSQRTGFSSGQVRVAIEVTVAVLGWVLGGPLGAGTVVAALATGHLYRPLLPSSGPGRLDERRPARSSTPPGPPWQEVSMPERKQ